MSVLAAPEIVTVLQGATVQLDTFTVLYYDDYVFHFYMTIDLVEIDGVWQVPPTVADCNRQIEGAQA